MAATTVVIGVAKVGHRVDENGKGEETKINQAHVDVIDDQVGNQ